MIRKGMQMQILFIASLRNSIEYGAWERDLYIQIATMSQSSGSLFARIV